MSRKSAISQSRPVPIIDNVKRYKAWLAGEILPPEKMFISPTSKCNLRCKYCSNTVPGLRERIYDSDVDDETILRIVQEGLDFGIGRFNISGAGEPFLNKGLALAMMRKIKGGGAQGAITTNGVLLDKEILEAMLVLHWDTVIISLDSCNASTADFLRGRSVFKRCVSAIKALNALKEKRALPSPSVSLNVVITSYNYTHVPNILRFASGLGIYEVQFIPVTVRDPSMESYKLSDRQALEFQKIIRDSLPVAREEHISRTNLTGLLDPRITTGTGNMKSLLLSGKRERAEQRPSMVEDRASKTAPLPVCYEPWSCMAISPDGSLNPCQHNSKASKIGDRPLRDAWQNDPFLELMRLRLSRRNLPDFCQVCCSAIVVDLLVDQHAARMAEGEK